MSAPTEDERSAGLRTICKECIGIKALLKHALADEAFRCSGSGRCIKTPHQSPVSSGVFKVQKMEL